MIKMSILCRNTEYIYLIVILIKNPDMLLWELDKLILKYKWKCTSTGKREDSGLTLVHYKIYNKVWQLR